MTCNTFIHIGLVGEVLKIVDYGAGIGQVLYTRLPTIKGFLYCEHRPGIIGVFSGNACLLKNLSDLERKIYNIEYLPV